MKREQPETTVHRHCMVVHAYYPLGETRVEREALALIDRGYEVDVLCLRDDGEATRERVDGVDIYRLPVKRLKGWGRAVQLVEYLAFMLLVFVRLIGLQARRRYQTVQVHNLPDFLVFAALPSKVAGARIILDLHDLMPEFFASQSGGSMTSRPVRLVIWQERAACRFADHVITVTDIWRDALIARGIPGEKVSVVMNVADSRIFNRAVEPGYAAESVDDFRLIYHGALTERYGVDLIVQAVDRLRRDIPGIHATLLGAGDAREMLVELVAAHGLEEHVYLSPGMLPADQLPTVIRQAHAGIVPNRSDLFTDGLLPTKLMEYVALGTPVIAAHTPTIAAYFDASMVQFFTPGDVDDLVAAVVTLHGDRVRLAEIARNSNRFNEQYSWPRVAADYVDLVDGFSRRSRQEPSTQVRKHEEGRGHAV